MKLENYFDVKSIIVRDAAQLQNMLEFISNHDLFGLDLETDGVNSRNNVVYGIGISAGLIGYYLPILDNTGARVWEESIVQMVLQRLNGKKLLAWNGTFEAQFCEVDLKWKFVESFHADCMLMLHTLDENLHNYALKDNSEQQLGSIATTAMHLMLASMKENGGSGYEYCKASTESLGHYCVWDCVLTEWWFHFLTPRLEAEGTLNFFYSEVMELYKLVTIPMEAGGVRLDIPKLQAAQEEISMALVNIENKIQAEIAPFLPEFETWFLNKDFPPARSGAFAQGICAFYGLDLPKTATGAYSLAAKNIEALPDCLGKEILLQKSYIPNEDVIKIQRFLYNKMQAETENFDYMFNLLSKHHLKKLFFDILKEQPLSTTDKGNPQVDDEFITKMGAKYPWAAELSIYNRLTKIKGTYIDRFLDAAEGDRFYPQFYQHRTVSGRYGGDLQQLPRPIESTPENPEDDRVIYFNNQIRTFFIADEGCILIDDDYEAAEPRTFAHVSNEPALKEVFANNECLYSKVCIMVENCNEYSAVKSAPNFLGKLNKAKRQFWKIPPLAIAYGAEGYALSFQMGKPVDEMDLLVKNYFRAFPNVKKGIDAAHLELITTGRVKVETGRVRHMPKAKQIYERYGVRIVDSLQLWKDYNHDPKLYEQMKRIRREFKNYLNNAFNIKIQGRVASMMNLACIKIAKEFRRLNIPARLVAQIHDELIAQCPVEYKQIVGEIIQKCMESSAPCSVPMIAIPSYGKNFLEAKGA